MPTYEYRHCQASPTCPEHIEVFGSLALADLKVCPHCGGAVERQMSAAGVISGRAHMMKEAHFSERGFTQYRKLEKGVYEKTAGTGPAVIKDDGKPL
jgi:putative FmdB family regulatory protein